MSGLYLEGRGGGRVDPERGEPPTPPGPMGNKSSEQVRCLGALLACAVRECPPRSWASALLNKHVFWQFIPPRRCCSQQRGGKVSGLDTPRCRLSSTCAARTQRVRHRWELTMRREQCRLGRAFSPAAQPSACRAPFPAHFLKYRPQSSFSEHT